MLSAHEIQRTYGRGRHRVEARAGASVDLRPGQRLAVVGRSGSGKSTLARVLALLEQPDAGRVTLDGEHVTRFGVRTPRAQRRAVQLIWQSPRQASDDRLRIHELILEPLIASGIGATRAEREAVAAHWIERTGIVPELLDRYPHEVSDGQLQRACLARALVLQPRYLICDEITSMLDVSTQAALLDVIAQEQRERDLGVLLITHDRVLANHWCDTHLHIDDGTITAPSTTPTGAPAHADAALPRE